MRRALLVALAAILATPAVALAAQVKDLDGSGHPTVRFTVVALTPTETPPTVTENGRPVAGLKAVSLARAKSVVLAVDRSQSMRGRPLADAVAAARAFVAAKPLEDRIAVATFATKPAFSTSFSTATIDADTALRLIAVDDAQGTTLYDALVLSANTLAAEPLPARVIIVVTDGNETRSEASLNEAIAAAKDAGAAVYVVAIESAKFTPEPLKELAAETGGTYYGAASSDALTAVYSDIAEELQRTWQLEYVTRARPGDRLALEVTVGAETAEAILTLRGGKGPESAPEPSRLLPEVFYTSSWGWLLIGGVVGLLVLVAAVSAFASPRGAWLRGRLDPHVASGKRRVKQRHDRERFAAMGVLFRATDRAFGNLRHFKRLQATLERADLPLRAAEFVYLMAACGLGLAFLAALFRPPIFVVPACLAVGALVPYGVVAYKARKRLRAFENQLPDMLVTMAASLKAGHSFRQGIQSVVDEGQEPASKEFKRVLTETRLGRPMDDALAEMSQRVGSKNFEFVMSAVTIQRQVGGSLASLFDMVADTVRQRQQFRRKIRGLTAMGRLSAYVLVGLPFVVALAISAINPPYMEPLYTTSTGKKLIGLIVVMMTFGSLILKKIVSFKG